MKKFHLLLLLLFFSTNSYTQILKGQVCIYTKGVYAMDNAEDWERVALNGGIQFTRKGLLNFKESGITFIVGFTDNEDEVYKNLSFQHESIKKSNIFSAMIYTLFLMKEGENASISVQYFPKKYFESNRGIFIISDLENRIMYFFLSDIEEEELVNNLYK